MRRSSASLLSAFLWPVTLLAQCPSLVDFVAKGDVAGVTSLLTAGVDPNCVSDSNVKGWTPLMAAANAGSTEVAKALLKAGANVNAKNEYGATPLDIAVVGHGTSSDIALTIFVAGGRGRNNYQIAAPRVTDARQATQDASLAQPAGRARTGTQVDSKSRRNEKLDLSANQARIVETVGGLDEYRSLRLPDIIKTFDTNHVIDALPPLERQAVLDVLLARVYVTRVASFKIPFTVPKTDGGYLRENQNLSASGGTHTRLRDGTEIKLTLTGTSVKPGGEVFQIGTGTEAPNSYSITKDSIVVKGSLTISSVLNDTVWIVSTELPRDRIAMTGFVMGMSLAWPVGDGTIYGFRGTIRDFLPGVTIRTTSGHTAYFALVADMGLVYLAGEAAVSSDQHPNVVTTLPKQ